MIWIDEMQELHDESKWVCTPQLLHSIYKTDPDSWQAFGRNGIDCIRHKNIVVSVPGRFFPGLAIDSQETLDEAIQQGLELQRWLEIEGSESLTPSRIAIKIIYDFLGCLRDCGHGLPSKHVHKATFGGKIDTYLSSGDGPVSEWDIVSAYPNALAEIPGIGPFYADPKHAMRDPFSVELWHCELLLPNTRIGTLPARDKHGVFYPSGRIKGTWWGVEIKTALALGAKLKKIHYGWRWKPTTSAAFVGPLLESARENFPLLSTMIKVIGVCIIGCLAQTPSQYETVLINPDNPPEVGDVWVDINKGIAKRKRKKKAKPPQWSRRHVASYVWAKVRAELTYQAHCVPQGKLISCHTDGLLIEGEHRIDKEMWRRKKTHEGGWHCPWNGAFFVGKDRVRAPGLGADATEQEIREMLGL